MSPAFADFTDLGLDVIRCERCHRVVRLYDARNHAEAGAMLEAHRAFNCVDAVTVEAIAGSAR